MFSKRVIRDEATGDPYLIRWELIVTRWFSLKLHRILRPDWARDLHDHPWWFVALVLRGGYVEEVEYAHIRKVRWFNWKPATGAHRIVTVKPNTWTLVLTGPRCRKWGFYTVEGWVHWKRYLLDNMATPRLKTL